MDPTMPPPTAAAPPMPGGSQQTQMTPEQLQQAIMMMNLLGQGQQGMGNQMMGQAQQQNASLGDNQYNQTPGISPQASPAMFGGAM